MGKQPLPQLMSDGDIKSPNGDGQADDAKFPDFRARLHSAALLKDLTSAKIAAHLGITRGTMARYWDGDRLPPADLLVAISELLGVSERWLIRGHNPADRGHLVDANSAEWVTIPEYNLKEMTDASKGPVVSETPFRKDWLYMALGQNSGLWLTRLPADYEAASLFEGDLVFARDVAPGEATDRALYIFRVEGTLSLARLDAFAESASRVGDRQGERLISFRHFGREAGQASPVARVMGVPLMRV